MFKPLNLTEEQAMLQQTAREFALNEVAPRVPELEKSREFPWDLVKRCGELGFMRVMVPEALGGLGLGTFEMGLIVEEIAKVCPGFSMTVQSIMQGHMTLLAYPDLADKFGPAMEGEIICETAVTDPAGSTNIDEWSVMAKRDGDNWIINGTKNFVSLNKEAAVCFFPAKCDDGEYRMFAIEKGHPGFDNSHLERTMGFASGTTLGSVTWNNVKLPNSRCIPFVPDFASFGSAILTMSTSALGCAEGALEKTVEFCKNRTRSSKPLTDLQVVSHKLARHLTSIEYARCFLYNAYRECDAQTLTPETTCMVKAWIVEMALDVTRDCVQLHGGLGICEDTGIARYYRDAMHPAIGDWTPDLHYQTIANKLGWQASRGL